MGKLIILIGVPLSGKTTWAKNYLKDNKAYYVSRDSERESCFGEYRMGSQREEDTISEIIKNKVYSFLTQGDVILDNTHCKQSDLDNLISVFGHSHDMEFIKIEPVSKEELIKRNQSRFFETGKLIPERVIHKKLKELQELNIPANIYHKGAKTDPRVGKYKYDGNLKDCCIFDLDGTISLMNGRNPFSGKDCGSDEVNQSLRFIMESIKETTEIFIFSGRNSDNSGTEETEFWLAKYNIPYNHLVMREEKDHRPDVVIKKEMYDKYIRNQYNVLAVFDDRPCVIRLWDSLGLPVYDVHPTSGEF